MKKRDRKKAVLSNNERAEEWMKILSREHPEVRSEISDVFPAYNSLLNLHAVSFNEFALRSIAREKGLPYQDVLFDYRSIKPPCPRCAKADRVQHKGKGSYFCADCNTKFAANINSISSGFRLSSVVWRKVLQCMLDFYTLKRACNYCGIAPNTYYNIRNRIFYAMQLMMNDVKLFGNIQVDNTFAYLSYKGSALLTEQYPEDSPFGGIELAPRGARTRGGSYKNSEKHKNSVCIFAAIDDYGHVMVRFIGPGTATAKKLVNSVGTDKILQKVPECDPFEINRAKTATSIENAGVPSVFIADGERAIKKFADVIGIFCESNVYRRHGRQIRLKEGAHDIQRVNSLHSRLKNYLRNIHYVSSKYLPGFLTMFEFIENTKASDEAIGKLFEILATPGLGQDASFYKNMFSAPDAAKSNGGKLVKEPEVDESIKKKYGKRQLIALYLYDAWKKGEIANLSSTFLCKLTRCTMNTAKTLYEEALASDRIDEIRDAKRMYLDNKVVPSDILDLYDRLAEMRKKPPDEQISLTQFVRESNVTYNTKYSVGNAKFYIDLIPILGMREPLLPYEKQPGPRKEIRDKYLYLFRERQRRYRERRANNEPVTFKQIEEEMSSEYGIPVGTMQNSILRGMRLEKTTKKEQ